MPWLLFIFITLLPIKIISAQDKLQNCDFIIINKITAVSQILQLSLFETSIIDSLSIKFYDAFLTETKGYAALIQAHTLPENQIIFSGWLFSKSFSLNPVENSLYDIKLLKCSSKTEENS